MARLGPIDPVAFPPARLGDLAGQFTVPDDFDEWSDEDDALWYGSGQGTLGGREDIARHTSCYGMRSAPERLPQSMVDVLADTSIRKMISVVSLTEIAIKVSTGKPRCRSAILRHRR